MALMFMLYISVFAAKKYRYLLQKNSRTDLGQTRLWLYKQGMPIEAANPLEITDLFKSYGTVEAVRGVSLSMARGEIFGLLGPNGAGKTTIISILVTLERPTSGKVAVFGHDVLTDSRQAKVNVGWVPQEVINHGFFTVEEILEFHAGFYGRKLTGERAAYLLNRLSLWDHRHKRVRELSGGMKRRLMIAKALVHEPKLLLLDEPTAGVDIELRATLWDFVKELKREGVSILLTTHYLEEAEELCDRVAFIDNGQIRKMGATAALVRDLTRKRVVVTLKNNPSSNHHPWVESRDGLKLTLNMPMEAELGQVLNELALPMQSILDIHILEGTLEDAFSLSLTGGPMIADADVRWRPFLTLFHREVRRFMKVLVQTVVTPFINSSLYLLIFGVSLGRNIQLGQGYNYLAFLIPGLVMMGCLNNSFQNSSSSIVTAKFGGDLEDFRVSALSNEQMIWAFSFGGMIRGFIVGFVTFIIGELFYYGSEGSWLAVEHPFLLVLFLAMGSLTFAKLGISVAFWAKTFDQLSAVTGFILVPLTYLGGVFFSLEHLHPFWRAVSQANPLLYFINGVRLSVLGHADVNMPQALVVSLLATVICHFMALMTLSRAQFKRW